jgi:hypothetical protein
VHRFCNVVWTWCLARVSAERQEEWLFQMAAPLPGDKPRPVAADEPDTSGFMALMSQVGAT